MKAIIQRVKRANVRVDDKVISSIDVGFLTLLGVTQTDTSLEVERLMKKILNLRVFEDESRKMNLSLLDVSGAHLIVSQFTLYADTSRGNRPSFQDAAVPDHARPLYEKAIEVSRAAGIATFGGRFGASMQIDLVNDGPVTIVLEV